MNPPALLNRRAALKRAAISLAALPLFRTTPALTAAEAIATAPPGSNQARSLKLSVATISLRQLTVSAAASVLNQLEIRHVSIFREHAPFESGTAEQCRAAAEVFRQAGLHLATTSVVNLTNDEAASRRAFDNVRAAGIALMTCRPAPEAMPLLEKLVQEYDLRLAIHNHGPEDKLYPSPYEALKLVESLDPRIGLCLDVGHTMRAHVDPAEAIHRCAARLYDVHLKDSLAFPGAEDIPVEVGRGRMDIKGILTALTDIGYAGVVAFEYERMGVNPTIGLAESVGYVRGMLRAM